MYIEISFRINYASHGVLPPCKIYTFCDHACRFHYPPLERVNVNVIRALRLDVMSFVGIIGSGNLDAIDRTPDSDQFCLESIRTALGDHVEED